MAQPGRPDRMAYPGGPVRMAGPGASSLRHVALHFAWLWAFSVPMAGPGASIPIS